MQPGIVPHWDLFSIVFYVFLALLGAFAVKYSERKPYVFFRQHRGSISVNKGYCLWWFVWTMVAAFRLINRNGIGGTDAYGYKNFFWICNGASFDDSALILQFSEHYELLWKLLNRFVRLFTGNYRVFFVLVYGFITWSFQKVIKSFSYERIYVAPFICLFFVYLRGFNTLRTETAIAFILLMVLALKKNNYIKAIIFGLLSIGFQISSALYVLLIPFHFLYKKKQIKIGTVILMIVLASAVGKIGQIMLTGHLGQVLGHSYSSYASKNIGHSFLENYWKIAFGQILIGGLIVLFDKKLKEKTPSVGSVAASIQFVREVCLFDVITIPVTFVLNIWRGYEYLYIMRLMMWSYATSAFLKGKEAYFKCAVCAMEVVVFTAWLVFRINHTWESSGYLPYVLSIFE